MGEDRHTGHSRQSVLVHVLDEIVERPLHRGTAGLHFRVAIPPDHHHGYDKAGDHERKPAAMQQLGKIRGKEDHLDRQDQHDRHHKLPGLHVPDRLRQEQEEQRGEQQGARNRKTVCGSQGRRRLEDPDEQQDADEQDPVDGPNVDLAAFLLGGVLDVQAWQQAQTGGLP